MLIPSPAGAAALLRELPRLAADRRTARGLSIRQAAAQIGIVHNTLGRLEAGRDVGHDVAARVLDWLEGTGPTADADDGVPEWLIDTATAAYLTAPRDEEGHIPLEDLMRHIVTAVRGAL